MNRRSVVILYSLAASGMRNNRASRHPAIEKKVYKLQLLLVTAFISFVSYLI
jgi:hypothetical protein